jgi:hypothetical protein
MRSSSILVALATIALIACAPLCRAAARAEILPIDDKDLATMDKEEAKRARDVKKMDAEMTNTGEDSQCGSVAIGNNDSATQRGSARVAPTETTVIVTGNVYNTASCGR